MECRVCGITSPLFAPEPISWAELVSSARSCMRCDTLVRGCRGWLNLRGWSETTPNAIRYSSNTMSDIKEITLYLSHPNETIITEQAPAVEALPDNSVIPSTFSQGNRKAQLRNKHDGIYYLGIHSQVVSSSTFPLRRRTTGFTGSSNALQLAKEWIQHCTKNHEECDGDNVRRLPTRIIDVGPCEPDGPLKLVESLGRSGQYVALSHCWGNVQPYTTTRANLVSHMQYISSSQLTKTFKEAVEVTRALGMRYLWIDSLCIIQGDPADWAKEASRMSQVYRNAYVTIAATASSSGNEGLYRPFYEYNFRGYLDSNEPCEYLIAEHIAHMSSGPSMQAMVPEDSDFNEKLVTLPLTSRGWILQERLLSPRMLHFGSHELALECTTATECECGIYTMTEGSRNLTEIKSYIHAPATFRNSETGSITFGTLWQDLVQMYSHLNLTKSSDKLVACGGLARSLQPLDDRYLAGLWESCLLEQLHWTVDKESRTRPVWRAPSWSWASVDDPVSFLTQVHFCEIETLHAAEVISCTTIPKASDNYGQIASGSLRLRGYCKPVKRLRTSLMTERDIDHEWLQFPCGSTFPYCQDCIIPTTRSTPTSFTTARGLERTGWIEEDQEGLLCLLLGKYDRDGDFLTTGLVLRCLYPGRGIYERIGFLYGWWDTYQSREDQCSDEAFDDSVFFPAERQMVEIV
jgi:hypothetical protein